MSHLEAHAGFFRLLMKGIFDPYVLWPFDKKFIFELITWVRTHEYNEEKQGLFSKKHKNQKSKKYLV